MGGFESLGSVLSFGSDAASSLGQTFSTMREAESVVGTEFGAGAEGLSSMDKTFGIVPDAGNFSGLADAISSKAVPGDAVFGAGDTRGASGGLSFGAGDMSGAAGQIPADPGIDWKNVGYNSVDSMMKLSGKARGDYPEVPDMSRYAEQNVSAKDMMVQAYSADAGSELYKLRSQMQ